jgi:hypothetical protein
MTLVTISIVVAQALMTQALLNTGCVEQTVNGVTVNVCRATTEQERIMPTTPPAGYAQVWKAASSGALVVRFSNGTTVELKEEE